MTHQGKITALGVKDPDAFEAALAAFRKLLDSPAAEPDHSPTVPEACARYLADCHRRVAAGRIQAESVRNYRKVLDQFAAAFADVQISRLRGDQAEEWVYSRTWSPSYQNDALGVLGALFRFHGFHYRFRKPPKESRGAEVALTDEQFAAVLRDLTGPRQGRRNGSDIGAILTLLRETGARPTEGARLTVEGIDWPAACARIRQHKTRHRTGRDRVLHFNSAAMAVLEKQREKWGTGWLFRTINGRPYTAEYLGEVLTACSRRVGFRVIAYGLGRHSFATSALANGVPDALVAELLGQQGTGMLSRHYSHLGQRAQALKAAAELASRRP